MNMKFILNEYVLIWNLLFRESITLELNDKKQKIYFNYKNEYNHLFEEKDFILNNPDNYIPGDDRVYNVMKEEEVYNNIYNNTDNFKLSLRKMWNTYKKDINCQLDNILRISIKEYEIFVVDPRLNLIVTDSDLKLLIYGVSKNNDKDNLIDLIYNIVKKELTDYYKKDSEITEAILELTIKNELATRLNGISYYIEKDNKLSFLKRRIYPYFLMYLGVKKEDFKEYMKRDGIVFDINTYKYDDGLNNMNIYEFINFCINNREKLLDMKELEII